jgi:hypothetical protein
MPYNRGASKALSAMRKKYGTKRGTSIFFARANKYKKSAGKRPHTRANATYRKGAKLRRR